MERLNYKKIVISISDFVIWSLEIPALNYDILASFIGATAALAMAPGPDNMYVLMQSLVHGKKYGMATVLGLVSGCLIHTSLLAFGVSALIKQHAGIFFIIKLFGAAYLLFLAYNVFKLNGTLELSEKGIPKKNTMALFKQGFLMNVLNPKVSIFFLAFYPGFLFSDALSLTLQFYVLGFLFMGVSFVIFSALTILSGTISERIKENVHLGVYIKWLQIVVFVSIAIYLLLSDK